MQANDESDDDSNFYANVTFPIPRDFDATHDITNVSADVDESFNRRENYDDSTFPGYNVSMIHDAENFTQNFENSIIIEDSSIKLEENEGEITFSRKTNSIHPNYYKNSIPEPNEPKILVENREKKRNESLGKPKIDFISMKNVFLKYLLVWIILIILLLVLFIISITSLAIVVQTENNIAELKNEISKIQSNLVNCVFFLFIVCYFYPISFFRHLEYFKYYPLRAL